MEASIAFLDIIRRSERGSCQMVLRHKSSDLMTAICRRVHVAHHCLRKELLPRPPIAPRLELTHEDAKWRCEEARARASYNIGGMQRFFTIVSPGRMSAMDFCKECWLQHYVEDSRLIQNRSMLHKCGSSCYKYSKDGARICRHQFYHLTTFDAEAAWGFG